MSDIMWWGYLNENGYIQVNRWFGDHKDYTDDCDGSPFVIQVVPPFKADSRDEAFMIINGRINFKDGRTNHKRGD